MCGRWKSRGLLRGLDNSLPARTKEAESGGLRFAELFTQSRSLPLYGAPTFHWHLTFVFKESKVTKRPLSPLLSSLSPLASEQLQTERRVHVCVPPLCKDGHLCRVHPTSRSGRQPISKDKRSFPHDF